MKFAQTFSFTLGDFFHIGVINYNVSLCNGELTVETSQYLQIFQH